jgi:hypothetical protein
MNFEVYCDESSPEVLSDRNANKFLVLGSVWLPSDYRSELKDGVSALKKEHNYSNEIKWNKVSPSSENFYLALVRFFCDSGKLRFRSIIVEAEKIDMIKFHNDDTELSFYKFYYQLLHHWILDFNDYSIFLDYKVNKSLYRVHKLKEVLSNANLFSSINNVQALPSHESIGIQLADFLTGALSGKFNEKITSKTKLKIISELENCLGRPIQRTPRTESKFNVFKINLQGGW